MSSVVIKLGSSIVADERGGVRDDVLRRLCDEIAELHFASISSTHSRHRYEAWMDFIQ